MTVYFSYQRLMACIFCLLTSANLALADAHESRQVFVEIGKAFVLPQHQGISTVFVADNDVADASIDEFNRIFIFGKSVGETTLFTSSEQEGHERNFTIVVTHALTGLRRLLRSEFPRYAVKVSSNKGSIFLDGDIDDELARRRIVQAIQAAEPNASVIDRLQVTNRNAISLRVRLLEVNRSRADNFGVDWDALVVSNGFFLGANDRGLISLGKDDASVEAVNATLDVLTSNGVITISQESLLTTVEGETARFEVGGEFPIPTFLEGDRGLAGSLDTFQVDYKFTGTSLNFTPTFAPGEKLRLEINGTVSSVDDSSGTINGDAFPNLISRSISTKVDLRDQQPFVIAGLSRSDSVSNLKQPRQNVFSRIVNGIFGADTVSTTEQELVIMVTPFLTEEKKSRAREIVTAPLTNLEYIVTGRNGDSGKITGRLPRSISLAGFQY